MQKLSEFRSHVDDLIDTLCMTDMLLMFIEQSTRLKTADLFEYFPLVNEVFPRTQELTGCELPEMTGRIAFHRGLPAETERTWFILLANSLNGLHGGILNTCANAAAGFEQFEGEVFATRQEGGDSPGLKPILDAVGFGESAVAILPQAAKEQSISLSEDGIIECKPGQVVNFGILMRNRWDQQIGEICWDLLANAVDDQFMRIVEQSPIEILDDDTNDEGDDEFADGLDNGLNGAELSAMQRDVINAIVESGGSCKLADIAQLESVRWDHESIDSNWGSLRTRINQKIKPMGFHVYRKGNAAHLGKLA